MTETQVEVGTLRAGDLVPVLERTIRLVDMVVYAGATWDWHRLHYDRDEAERVGAPAPVVDGQALGAYLAEQVVDWLGPRTRVRRMSFRFRSMVHAGETIRVEGEVGDVVPGDAGPTLTVRQLVTVGDRVAAEGETVAEVGRWP